MDDSHVRFVPFIARCFAVPRVHLCFYGTCNGTRGCVPGSVCTGLTGYVSHWQLATLIILASSSLLGLAPLLLFAAATVMAPEAPTVRFVTMAVLLAAAAAALLAFLAAALVMAGVNSSVGDIGKHEQL